MIVRELLARFGVDFDEQSVRRADRAVEGLTQRARRLGEAIGVGFAIERVSRFGLHAIEAASDVTEAMNVINQSFEDNAQQVVRWSRETAREVGRSQFNLQEMAGTLGAVLNPMMENNAALAAGMSTRLSKLAVDLASFFNTTDQDALQALRSGLVGEPEPLRRFGIVLLQSTLQQFAFNRGIQKSVKDMSIAEKTLLRYQFILDQTQKAQGDAARTADEYANASRAVKDGLHDLSVTIGQRFLGAAKQALAWMRETVPKLQNIIRHSHILEGVLIGLGTAAAVVFAPYVLSAAKFALIMGGIALLADELITLFEGGETAIGHFIDSMFGVGATQVFLDSLKTGWEQVGEATDWATKKAEEFGEAASFVGDQWAQFADGIIDSIANALGISEDKIRRFIDKVGDLITDSVLMAIPGVGPAVTLARKLADQIPEGAAEELRTRKYAVGPGLDSPAASASKGAGDVHQRVRRARELDAQKRRRQQEAFLAQAGLTPAAGVSQQGSSFAERRKQVEQRFRPMIQAATRGERVVDNRKTEINQTVQVQGGEGLEGNTRRAIERMLGDAKEALAREAEQ